MTFAEHHLLPVDVEVALGLLVLEGVHVVIDAVDVADAVGPEPGPGPGVGALVVRHPQESDVRIKLINVIHQRSAKERHGHRPGRGPRSIPRILQFKRSIRLMLDSHKSPPHPSCPGPPIIPRRDGVGGGVESGSIQSHPAKRMKKPTSIVTQTLG